MAEKKKKAAENAEPRAPAMSAEDFVVGWQDAKTLAEARETLGAGASARAQRLRKAGVKLQVFPSGRKPIDVKTLNALIK